MRLGGYNPAGVVLVVVLAAGCSKPQRSDLAECFDLCASTGIARTEYQRRARVADAGVRQVAAGKPPVDAGPRLRYKLDENGFRILDENGWAVLEDDSNTVSAAPLPAPEEVRDECARLCIARGRK